MIDVAIHPLGDHVDTIPCIAEWFYDEWRQIYGNETLASVRQRIETWVPQDRIPTALVAVAGNQVIGTVALKNSELHFPYSPWLAGLFVIPRLRHQGIGALLVGAAERKAASLGIGRLYLYTPSSQAFYEKLGWSVWERSQLPSGPLSVMSKRLSVSPVEDQTAR